MLKRLYRRFLCFIGIHDYMYSDHIFDDACGISGECDESVCRSCGKTKIVKDE